MKIKIAAIAVLGVAVILAIITLSDKNENRQFSAIQNEENREKKESKKKDKARFRIERLKYEYDLLKDPVTGKIPENIFDRELAIARQLPVRSNDAVNGAPNMRVLTQNSYLPAGPNNIGGRTRAVAYDLRYNGNTNRVIIAGCVSGGIMRSADGGNTWTLVTPQNDIHSFTVLAQDPRAGFQDTWYAAGGEPYGNTAGGPYSAPYRGLGVWKSTNNGVSWTKLNGAVTDQNGNNIPSGSHELFDNPFDYTYNMVVNPTNGDLFIAAFGTIIRSINGGNSFQVVLGSFSGSTSLGTASGQTEVAINTSGRILAAINGANSAALRGIWTSSTGNPGSFSRVAGGQTVGVDSVSGWRANDRTLQGKRILVTFAPSNPNVGYVFYENGLSSEPPDLKPEADLFRFDIAGNSFTWSNRSANMPDFPGGNASGSDPLAVQGGYDMMVKVKPDDPNVVFIGGTNLYRSTDGFATAQNTAWINGYSTNFTYSPYPNGHPDMHDLVFNPINPNEGISANDGGLQICSNLTATSVTWRMVTNYQTLQYYYIAMDPDAGRNNFVGGAQDNGVMFRDKLRVLGVPASDSNNHVQLISADGTAVGISRISTSNPNQYVYGGYQFGNIIRFRITNGFASADIKPTGLTTAYEGATEEFGEFITNFRLNPDNTEDLYYVNFNRLFRTTAASSVTAGGWTELTGVSAAVNPANPTGGRNVAIRAIAFTRGTYNTSHSIYLGTTNGRIYRLDDPRNAAANKIPADITPNGMNGNVQDIAVNPNNDNEVMAVVSNYNTTSIWWTNNAKSVLPTWRPAEGNISLPSIRSCMIVVKKDAANNPVTEYYVGTSVGLYSTENLETVLTSNGAPLWMREGDQVLNLAVVQSLAYRPVDNVMVIGTHGNGMYYTFLGTPNFNPVQTSIEPVTNDKNFITAVYPTLTSGSVHFQTGTITGVKKIHIQVFDISGRQVYGLTAAYSSGSFSLHPFAKGAYVISIWSEDRRYRHIQKVVRY